MKLAWGLMECLNALWVKVLGSKYNCGQLMMPQIYCNKKDSNPWKDICNIWNNMKEGIRWIVCNGLEIRF